MRQLVDLVEDERDLAGRHRLADLGELERDEVESETWAVNVFEAATPTSSPQRVYRTESTSRVIWEPIMFVIATVRAPFSRASFIASIVSRVSPDWEMPITSVSSSITGLR